MTKYQILIDSITTELFCMWKNGSTGSNWNEENAKEISHRLLTLVEKYQENSNNVYR